MKKGYMTVFFALIFMVILSFILSVFEGLKINATRVKAECGYSIAANSILGEYHKELLEQYDLFYVDTSYQMANPNYHYVEAHFWNYLEENFDENIQSIELDGITLATDQKGVFFRKQITGYMEDKIGISYVDKIKENYDIVSANGFLKESNIEDGSLEKWQKAMQSNIEISEETWKQVETYYPMEEVSNIKKSFVLEQVLNSQDKVSENKSFLENYVSKRECIKGSGEYKELGFMDKIYFTGYVFEKFANFTNIDEKNELTYEIEYLIGGKSSDYENLSEVVKEILLLREGANLFYLLTDSEKMSLIENFSLAIGTLICCPEIEPIITASIVGIWSYMESVEDVKSLLHEGKVPLIKTKDSWNTDLDSVIGLKFSKKDKVYDEGMDYEEYLQLLLLFMDNESLTFRCMDLMEMDIRQMEGNEAFRMDGLAENFSINIVFDISMFGSYQIVRKFGYFS